MTSLLGKIVETHIDTQSPDSFVLGRRLSALRELAGISNSKISEKLGISEEELCRLENRQDIQVSIIKYYIEALGATLSINATFPANSPVDFRIADAFDE